MKLAIIIALAVGLVAIRLTLAPWPAVIKMSIDRWGKRTTAVLFAIALAGLGVAIVIARL